MIYKSDPLSAISPLSLEERFKAGKQIRQQVGRSSLAECSVVANRKSSIDILLEQAKSRIAELIPIRHARMAQDPFAFYRGGAAIMAKDLSTLPSPPIPVQLGGDMHVSNFGFFSTTEHRLVFGINDFDETLPGNFDWDLKRLTASAMIAAQILGKDKVYGEQIVRNIVSAYRHNMQNYAQMPYIELKRAYIDAGKIEVAAKRLANTQSQRYLDKLIRKAYKNSNYGLIGKLIEKTSAGNRLIDNPPLIQHRTTTFQGGDFAELVEQGFASYLSSLNPDRQHLISRYHLIDSANKVVGVGSVGTSSLVLYFEGIDERDPLFLQAKEAQKSVLTPYFPDTKYASQGERVVHGQCIIQGAPDLFLGYGKNDEKEFYVRQLRDMKGGISVGEDGINSDIFPDFAKLFGWALANAHARSGDPAVLAGYCGKSETLDDALVEFSSKYCQQNADDYNTFLKAIQSGKIVCASEKI